MIKPRKFLTALLAFMMALQLGFHPWFVAALAEETGDQPVTVETETPTEEAPVETPAAETELPSADEVAVKPETQAPIEKPAGLNEPEETLTITLESARETYNGSDQTPGYTVVYGETELNAGEFTAVWTNSSGDPVTALVNAGRYTLTVTYGDASATAAFVIAVYNFSSEIAQMTAENVSYTGKAVRPATVSYLTNDFDEGTFTEGTEYTVASNTSNINVGEATMVINGIGNYGGQFTLNYNIVPADISTAVITVDPEACYIDDVAVPTVTAKLTTGVFVYTLVEGTDYTYQFKDGENNVVASPSEIGTYTIVLTGKGNFEGETTKTFIINAATITLAKSSLTTVVGNSGDAVAVKKIDGGDPTAEQLANVTWTSSDETVATVDSTGAVTSIAAGTATITATYAGATASYALTVSAATASITKDGTTKYYSTLKNAITAAATGDTIVLTADSNRADFISYSGKAITIDLAGHSYSRTNSGAAVQVSSNAALTITDSVGGGVFAAANGIGIETKAATAVVNVEGGTVRGTNFGISSDNGTVNVSGGTVISSNTSGIRVQNATVTISGGTVSGKQQGILDHENSKASTITITGGTIICTGTSESLGDEYSQSGAIVLEDASELTISGENTVITGGYSGIAVFDAAEVTVNGGTITGDVFGITGNGTTGYGGYTITINDGSVSATNESGVGLYHPNTGTVTIAGGTVSGATGVYQKSGTLAITGGSISATGAQAEYTYNGNGANSTGDAVVIDSCGYPGGTPALTVSGSPTLTSANGVQIADYTYEDNTAPSVTSGSDTFTLPEGQMWVSNGSGGFVIGQVPEAVDGYTAAQALASDFETEHYNKHSNGDSLVAADTYYVKVVEGYGNLGSPESITLNGTEYGADDTFVISVGNNAFVTFNYYKLIDGDLYVAFPAVLFEMNGASTIVAGDFTFEYASHSQGNMTVAGTNSQDENYITITGEGSTFNITANSSAAAHYWIAFDLEGVDTSAPLITKKVQTYNETTTVSYGFTAADGPAYTGGTNGGIAYYPFGWSDAIASGDHGTVVYSIYSVGNGKMATLNLSLNAVQPEAVSTLLSDAAEAADAYVAAHYNKHSNGDVIEAGSDFYVKAVTGNGFLGTPESITINGVTYSNTDTFELSVGMNAKVTGNFFKVTDGDLYVAFPIALFEMSDSSTITAGSYTFSYAGETAAAAVTEVRGQKVSDSAITVTAGDENAYTIRHSGLKPATEWTEIVIEDLAADQVMITKKVLTSGETTTTSYGMTLPDTSAHDGTPVLAFYAFGYSNSVPLNRDGDSYVYQAYLSGGSKTAALTLDLVCKEAFAVTFVDTDGTTEIAEMQEVVKNGKATVPEVPTKDGYTFSGWYIGETPYDFDTAVTENITLTAHWTLNVAKIGDKYYTSLADAVSAANTGDTIQMIADSEQPSYIEIPADKVLTLDLNGKTITSMGGGLDVYGGLTITDTSDEKNGKIIAERQAVYVDAGGSVTMDAGTLQTAATFFGFRVEEGATVTMTGGAITGSGNGIFNEGTVEISGTAAVTVPYDGIVNKGTAAMSGGTVDAGVFGLSNGGTFTITGGTLDGEDGGIFAYGDSTTNIAGGTVSSTDSFAVSTNGTGDTESEDYSFNAVINISGGTVTSENESAIYLPAGTFNITGGEITGSTGIFMRGGTLNVPADSTAVITGTGADNDPAFGPTGDGANSTGEALTIVACGYPAGLSNETVNVDGGTFISANADAVGSYATEGNEVIDEFVTGGIFSSDIDDKEVVDGSVVIPLDNGTYGVGVLSITVDSENNNAIVSAVMGEVSKTAATIITASEDIDIDNFKENSLLAIAESMIKDGLAFGSEITIHLNIELSGEPTTEKVAYEVTLKAQSGTESVAVTNDDLSDDASFTFKLDASPLGLGAAAYVTVTHVGYPEETAQSKLDENEFASVTATHFSVFELTPYDAVAQIGDTAYPSLRAAVEAAHEGAIIELLKDDHVSFTADSLELSISKSITIDGKGHTLYGLNDYNYWETQEDHDIFITRTAGNVTIKDLKISEFGGNSYVAGMGIVPIYTSGQYVGILTLDNVTIDKFNNRAMVLGGGTVVIDGCTVTGDTSPRNPAGEYFQSGIDVYNATVTITDTTVTGMGALDVTYGTSNVAGAIQLSGTGTVNVESGTFTGDYDLVIASAATGAVNISGGTFEGEHDIEADKLTVSGGIYTEYVEPKDVVEGKLCTTKVQEDGYYHIVDAMTVTFVTGEGASTAPEAQKIPSGETAVEPEEEPTKEGYTFAGWYLGEELYDFDTPVTDCFALEAHWTLNVAQIGSTPYPSLRAAVEAAQAGDTIELLTDDRVSFTADSLELAIDKAITIDGKGYTVYGVNDYNYWETETDDHDIFITRTAGNVTIKDLKISEFGGSSYVAGMHIVPVYTSGAYAGTLTLDNVTIDKFNNRAMVLGGGTVIIDGCTVTGDTSPRNPAGEYFQNGIDVYDATVTITDTTVTGMGALDVTYGTSNVAGAIQLTRDGSITVESGTFTGDYDLIIAEAATGTLTVNGGTFEGEHDIETDKLIVTGGIYKEYVEPKDVVEGKLCTTKVQADGYYHIVDAVTVTFVTGEGASTAPEAQVIPSGETAVEPEEVPTKEGYTFSAWYLGEDLFDFDTAVTANIELTAGFEINKYTIKYFVDDELVKEFTGVEHFADTPLIADPEKENYIFNGWLPEVAETVTGDAEYHATWKGVEKLILYVDGEGHTLQKFTVEYGQPTPAFTEEIPEREGYRYDPENMWVPAVAETVTDDAVYTVNWIRQFTVTFDPDNGDEITTVTLDEGDKVTQPEDPAKEGGYVFLGWYDGNNLFDFTVEVTTNVTLKAKYASIIWELSLPYTQGILTDEGATFEGLTVEYMPKDELVGRMFDGYMIGFVFTAPEAVTPDNIANTTYSNNNGTTWSSFADAEDGRDDDGRYIMRAWVELTEDMIRSYAGRKEPLVWTYKFAWDGDQTKAQTFVITLSPEDIVLKKDGEVVLTIVDWKEMFTIVFDTNGGVPAEIEPLLLPDGGKITPPEDPTREHYEFAGWFDGEEEYEFDEYEYEAWGNLHLTAHWTPKNYTIKYFVDDELVLETTAPYGSATPAVDEPTKENYVFNGWNPALTETVEGDVEYHATWKGAEKVVLYLDGMGTTLQKTTVEFGQPTPAFEGDLSTIEREGYRIDVDNPWTPEVEPTVTKDVAYNLNWIKLVNITFNPDNGENTTVITIDEGMKVAQPDDPVKEGYTFLGWFNGENKYDFDSPVMTDITLKANWTDSFNVTPVITDIHNTADSIYLTWDPVEGATKYNVYRKAHGATKYEVIAKGVTELEYEDTSVDKMGDKFDYAVRAYTGGKWTPYSDDAYIMRNPFVDVADDDSVFKQMAWVYNNKIARGSLKADGNRYFSPSESVTRQEFAIMLWRFVGSPSVGGTAKFTDMNDCNATGKKAITWASQQGIIKGFSDGSFKPNDYITRQQMAIMFWRLAGQPKVGNVDYPYDDLDGLASAARNAIKWCYSKGVAKGTAGKGFEPLENCLRKQLCVFIYNFNSKVRKYK